MNVLSLCFNFKQFFFFIEIITIYKINIIYIKIKIFILYYILFIDNLLIIVLMLISKYHIIMMNIFIYYIC
jgi:hypothetical protein